MFTETVDEGKHSNLTTHTSQCRGGKGWARWSMRTSPRTRESEKRLGSNKSGYGTIDLISSVWPQEFYYRAKCWVYSISRVIKKKNQELQRFEEKIKIDNQIVEKSQKITRINHTDHEFLSESYRDEVVNRQEANW